MSIAVYFIDGLSCPFFACNVCGDRITNPGLATCAWGEVPDDNPNRMPVGHYHKGWCLDCFEGCLPKGWMVMTEELHDHFEMLVTNTFKIYKRAAGTTTNVIRERPKTAGDETAA